MNSPFILRILICGVAAIFVSPGVRAVAQDCNANGLPDDADIAVGASFDCQANGIPDECEGSYVTGAGGRYLRVFASGVGPFDQPIDPSSRYALLFFAESQPENQCAPRPMRFLHPGGRVIEPVTAEEVPFLTPAEWCEVVISSEVIIPSQFYTIEASPEGAASGFGRIFVGSGATEEWADVAGSFADGAWNPPDDLVDNRDLLAVMDCFRSAPGAPPHARCDVAPPVAQGDCSAPDGIVDVQDLLAVLEAFRGRPYPCPAPCLAGP